MDKSSLNSSNILRRFLHAVGCEGDLRDREQTLVRGQGTPFAQFFGLHFFEAGVGHDRFVHRFVCSTGSPTRAMAAAFGTSRLNSRSLDSAALRSGWQQKKERGILAVAADERVADVSFDQDSASVRLKDGRIISVPLACYPRLFHATAEQRRNWKISGGGYSIHWPEIGSVTLRFSS